MSRRDPATLRLELVKRARAFKRSWVDMAEALVEVRDSGAYREFGFTDFHRYCEEELNLKRATVDKLTGSYVALERHAPSALARDGVAMPLPAMESVDYFAAALAGSGPKGRAPSPPPGPEVVEELRRAVFDENLPVAALRKRFEPVLRPKTDADARLDQLQRTSAATRKLAALLEGADFLDDDRRTSLLADLAALEGELDALAPSFAHAAG